MTNRGKVIISQQWLPEPVQSIQLPNGKKTIDEIYVMYPSSVCILQTKQLMQSIRSFEKLGEMRLSLGPYKFSFISLRSLPILYGFVFLNSVCAASSIHFEYIIGCVDKRHNKKNRAEFDFFLFIFWCVAFVAFIAIVVIVLLLFRSNLLFFSILVTCDWVCSVDCV